MIAAALALSPKARNAAVTGAAVVVVGALAWILLRRRAAESLARTVGRELGGAAVNVVTGTVGGAVEAVQGAIDSAAGVTPFQLAPVPGREFSPMQTNLKRLQGRIVKSGLGDGSYTFEVQNTGSSPLSNIRIELTVDKLGLDPVTELVGVVSLPARSGVRGHGRILTRSMSGWIPISARLYADKYLLAREGEGGSW